MKTIIAEKPSVAREIARIVGATRQEPGYLSGNGYAVTWAFGHLVQPAMPETYGIKGFRSTHLPIIPQPFILVPRQIRDKDGYKPDEDAAAQIKIIGELFRKSERIIVATDAGREGELIFRYLYAYLGCATPFDRLWISSLTDKAIRKGLKELTDGHEYDNLYLAAKARSEADWLVGINATQATSIAAGKGMYSIGRVQTPTLAMVCQRFWENKRFTPENYWQVHLVLKGENGSVVKFTSDQKWKDEATANTLYYIVKEMPDARVTAQERKEKTEDTPLLFDLTSLQKKANVQFGYSAEQTLSIAQRLYEGKLITYPRTGSRYIPEDVYQELPKQFSTLRGNSEWKEYLPLVKHPSKHSVDDTKVTDHHALLITGEKPFNLSEEEQRIYDLIVSRMFEAFTEQCVKEITTVTVECAEHAFTAKGTVIRQPGWRSVYGKMGEETDVNGNVLIPDWQENQELPVCSCSLTKGVTKPKPLHTEATLLSAMETCGKGIEDEALRQAVKDCGIGTPATRAAIIETLLKRDYVVRKEKQIVPTEKGLALYSVVKGMDVANVQMTGEWEKALAEIERGELPEATFRKRIEDYTRTITTDLLSCGKLFGHKDSGCTCPKCHTGKMQFYGKVVRCDNLACGLPIFRQKASRNLTDAEITTLLTDGHTSLLKGFKSKLGKNFEAVVAFDADYNTVFVFPEKKGYGKRK